MVDSGDVLLAVFERGDPGNPTVLLMHGYPDTHSVWDGVAALLANDFHVVSYDVRGAGESSAPRGRDAYRLEFLAADLLAVAAAVSPDRPVHVVAHDWGSIQAWEPVTDPGARDRIASFTSISGPCLDHVGYWSRRRLTRPTPRNLRQVFDQLLHSWYIAVLQLPVVAPLAWKLWLTRRWASVLRKTEGISWSQSHPAPTLASDAILGINLYRANIPQRLARPRQRTTEVPVQLIQPAGDRYVRPALTEDVERWVPRLWRRTLYARHWAPITHPAAIARMVSEFIGHVTGGVESRALRRARVGPRRRAFADRLAVVTGAGSGIGRATALAFAEQGAEVVVSDIDLDSAARTAERAGALAHAYQVNVADEQAMRKFAADVAAAHGVPDIVVNNAGIGHSGTFLTTSTKDWERVLDVNLWGVIYGCQAFGELMVARAEGGHIVNVSSAAAYLPSKILSAYATSKAAVFMLSDCLRAELGGSGIGVSTICPGIVNTNITMTTTFAGVGDEEQARKQIRTSELYRRRNFPPEGVAKEILRAVQHDAAVVPVTVEAKAARVLSRLAPSLLRKAAKLDVT